MTVAIASDVFRRIFQLLAVNPTIKNETLAYKIWAIYQSYNLSPEQLACDAELKELGLLRVENNIKEYGPQPRSRMWILDYRR